MIKICGLLCLLLAVQVRGQPECTENTEVRCAFGDQGCLGQGCCEDPDSPTTPCYIPDGPPEGPDGECGAADADKVDCGELATDRESCLAEGCCWKPLVDEAPYPWCFISSGGGGSTTTGGSATTTIGSGTTTGGSGTTTIGPGTTTTTPDDNSTMPGTGEYCDVVAMEPCNTGDLTCEDMGCCYDPTAPLACWHSEAPPRGPPGAQCEQTIAQKVECGVLGTDMQECIEEFGCCWRTRPESTEYDPWCYEALPEDKTDACEPNPCVNGECVEFKRGQYQCDCQKGYIGRHCQTVADRKLTHLDNELPNVLRKKRP